MGQMLSLLKIFESDAFCLSHCLSETNRNLEWKPNTNKGNKVNSNRWKKPSGRHLVSRNAPCRESRDDWKKRKNGKSERKKLKGKHFHGLFNLDGPRMSEIWTIFLEWNNSEQLPRNIDTLSSLETTRRQGNSRGRSYGLRSWLFHSWLSLRTRTEEDSQTRARLCGHPLMSL